MPHYQTVKQPPVTNMAPQQIVKLPPTVTPTNYMAPLSVNCNGHLNTSHIPNANSGMAPNNNHSHSKTHSMDRSERNSHRTHTSSSNPSVNSGSHQMNSLKHKSTSGVSTGYNSVQPQQNNINSSGYATLNGHAPMHPTQMNGHSTLNSHTDMHQPYHSLNRQNSSLSHNGSQLNSHDMSHHMQTAGGHPHNTHLPPPSYVSSMHSYPSSLNCPPASVFSRQSAGSRDQQSIRSYDSSSLNLPAITNNPPVYDGHVYI